MTKKQIFKVIIKQYENFEVASEVDFSESIATALNIMFDPYAMYDMNCYLNDDVLHIVPSDVDEFYELQRLWVQTWEIDPKIAKYIEVDKCTK